MSRTMVRRVFGWPAALATLAVLSVCTLFVYAADAFGYWGMPFDMADMVDMKIIYVSLPVLVCFGLNFLTVDAFTKQRAALRTLPIGSTRIGSILWVQMVALAPVWILVTCSPLLVYNRGATPPAILEISFLGLACGTGMTALWVAGAHVGTSPCKRTILMAIAMIATGPALIVLVVLAVLGKVPSYWLTPLVVALVGYTWVQREALAHMN
ncbi:MAG: hypothetical protein GY851_33470, partial [bacterium]|nr:hypothetical protein [bacterium]